MVTKNDYSSINSHRFLFRRMKKDRALVQLGAGTILFN